MDESSVERDDADSSDAHDDNEIQPIDGPYDEDAMLRKIEPLLRLTGDLAPTFEEVWQRLARRGWWRRDGVGLLDEIFLKPGATTRAPHTRDRDYFCAKSDLLRALRARFAAAAAPARASAADDDGAVADAGSADYGGAAASCAGAPAGLRHRPSLLSVIMPP